MEGKVTKFCRLFVVVVLIAVLAGVFGVASVGSPAEVSAAMLSSSNVAFVPSYYDYNVSPFPRTGTVIGDTSLSFDQFTFTDVPLASLTLANLAAYDTVVLNQVLTSNLTAQQQSDINSWVDAGGKLIIYDSDGTYSNDYSWFIRPFATNSPGQTGSLGGVLTVVEENTLSSANSASPYYINTAEIAASTDAVGDANVFTSQDPNWFADMVATNVNNVTGYVHAYAETPSGQGLIIYNGMDIDYFGYAYYYPSGIDWLAKVWYFELAQPWNPSGLPGTTPTSGQILLSPLSATLAVGQTQTMTATVKDVQGAPLVGVDVTFTVTGVNPTSGSATTDALGIATFSYAGANEGVDTVVACADTDIGAQLAVQSTVCSNDSHITWTPGMVPPVPEASTLILFGIGLLILGGVGVLVMHQKRRATV
jgi:hypothetical protein